MLVISSIPLGGVIDIGVRVGDFSILDPTFHSATAGWTGLPITGYSHVARMVGTSYRRINGVSPQLFYAGQPVVGASDIVWQGQKPQSREYRPYADFLNYSQPITSVFDISATTRTPPVGEHGVSHLTMKGRIRRRVPHWYDVIPYNDLRDGAYPWRIVEDNVGLYGPRYTATELIGGVPVSYSKTYPFFLMGSELTDVLSSLKDLQGYISSAGYIGGNSYYGPVDDVRAWCDYSNPTGWLCADIVDEVGDAHIKFRNFVWLPGLGDYMRVAQIEMRFSFEPVMPVPGVNLSGHSIYKSIVDVRCITNLCWNFPAAPGFMGMFGWHQTTTDAYTDQVYEQRFVSDGVCFPLTAVYHEGDVSSNTTLARLTSTAVRQEGRIKENFGLLRPASMFAHADAASKLRTTDMNFLEFAAEAGELFELLPALIGMFRRILSTGGNLPGLVLTIPDVIANFKLWHDFGVRPTGQTAVEAYRIAGKLGSDLHNYLAPQTVYGKFTYPIDDRRLGKGVLVARTKARYRGIRDDFILKLMRADAYGILPRTANIWDLIPFSWFIDYFANIGQRLTVWDAAIMAMVRGAEYFVHSYTIYDTLEATMDTLDLSGQLEAKFYFREVSNYVPLTFASEIDFGQPVGGPDYGIIAALLWNIFRG